MISACRCEKVRGQRAPESESLAHHRQDRPSTNALDRTAGNRHSHRLCSTSERAPERKDQECRDEDEAASENVGESAGCTNACIFNARSAQG